MAASRERTEENDGFHHSVHVADLTITDSIPGGGAACEDPRGTDAAEMVSSAHISSVGDQEDEGDQRGGSKARSGAPRAMDVDLPPLTQPSRADTHSLLVHNMSPANQAVSTASQLTAASVLKRTAELFPRGTTAPAAKPRQPPIVGKPTGELASLAFAASKDVELTRRSLSPNATMSVRTCCTPMAGECWVAIVNPRPPHLGPCPVRVDTRLSMRDSSLDMFVCLEAYEETRAPQKGACKGAQVTPDPRTGSLFRHTPQSVSRMCPIVII